MNIDEYVGIIALLFLCIALSQKDIRKLRRIGIFSAFVFLIQAVLLESVTLVLTNIIIIGIHIKMLIPKRNNNVI